VFGVKQQLAYKLRLGLGFRASNPSRNCKDASRVGHAEKWVFPQWAIGWHNGLLTLFNLLSVRSPVHGKSLWSGVAEGAGG